MNHMIGILIGLMVFIFLFILLIIVISFMSTNNQTNSLGKKRLGCGYGQMTVNGVCTNIFDGTRAVIFKSLDGTYFSSCSNLFVSGFSRDQATRFNVLVKEYLGNTFYDFRTSNDTFLQILAGNNYLTLSPDAGTDTTTFKVVPASGSGNIQITPEFETTPIYQTGQTISQCQGKHGLAIIPGESNPYQSTIGYEFFN